MTEDLTGGTRRGTRRDAHAPYDELVAGYALDALEPQDEELLLAHLPSCDRCREELAASGDALFRLVDGLDDPAPPPSLLAGIRAGIGIDAERLPGSGRPGAATGGTVVDLGAERRRRWRPSGRSIVSAAAAVALVASLGVWGSALRTDRDATNDRLVAVMAALRLDDARTVELRAADGAVPAVAVVGQRDGRRYVAVVADGLPTNDRARETYVLWAAMRFGDVRPVGAFDVSGTGPRVVAELPLAASAADLAGFAVTEEPGRTAPALPSTTPVVSGEIESA